MDIKHHDLRATLASSPKRSWHGIVNRSQLAASFGLAKSVFFQPRSTPFISDSFSRAGQKKFLFLNKFRFIGRSFPACFHQPQPCPLRSRGFLSRRFFRRLALSHRTSGSRIARRAYKILHVVCWFAITVAMMNSDVIGQCWLVLVFYHLFLSDHLALQKRRAPKHQWFSDLQQCGQWHDLCKATCLWFRFSHVWFCLQSSFACSSFRYDNLCGPGGRRCHLHLMTAGSMPDLSSMSCSWQIQLRRNRPFNAWGSSMKMKRAGGKNHTQDRKLIATVGCQKRLTFKWQSFQPCCLRNNCIEIVDAFKCLNSLCPQCVLRSWHLLRAMGSILTWTCCL